MPRVESKREENEQWEITVQTKYSIYSWIIALLGALLSSTIWIKQYCVNSHVLLNRHYLYLFCLLLCAHQVPSESSVGTMSSSTASSGVSRPVSLTSLGSCSSSSSSGPNHTGSVYLASAESLDSDPEPNGSQGEFALHVFLLIKLINYMKLRRFLNIVIKALLVTLKPLY